MPPAETSILDRDLYPELLGITFNNLVGSKNPTIEEYLNEPKQVQSMIMKHKGGIIICQALKLAKLNY